MIRDKIELDIVKDTIRNRTIKFWNLVYMVEENTIFDDVELIIWNLNEAIFLLGKDIKNAARTDSRIADSSKFSIGLTDKGFHDLYDLYHNGGLVLCEDSTESDWEV